MTGSARYRSAKQAPTVGAHDRWLVSYADFVTLLFAFFVVLFASVRHDNLNLQKLSKSIHTGFDQLGAHPPDATSASPRVDPLQTGFSAKPSTSMGELDGQLRMALSDSIASHQVVVEQNSEGLVISLRELGFFGSGDAQLLPAARDPLRKASEILTEHHLEVRVEGHSDDQPIHNEDFKSNWELSTARAMTVLQLLVNESGFDPTRISLAGYGPYRPIASNDTPEGRRTNRRVDIVVLGTSHDKRE